MGHLLLLALAAVLVAVVLFLVWSYRKKMTHKAAASQERYAQLFSASLSGSAPGQEAAIAASAVPQGAAAPVPEFSGKERLLSKSETLLFYLLRAGLPGHEIFAQVNLAAAVDIPPAMQDYERELRRRRLAQHSLDFVVCDKSTKIVAVVEFEAGTETAAFKAACLEAACIRHVRIKADALPGREDMHFLIYGNRSQPGV